MTAIREERRLVTCMFVDVVGSTELTARLGAERLKRELGVAFAELSQIVSAHGGTVEKYVGDAIYALFGAPVAHEDDPVRALRAAEAIRQWSVGGAARGHRFGVRVGVETGEAVVDVEAAATTRQRMSVGPVVNIAARLQQRAEPGEVLVGPLAREATDAVAEFEPLAEVELRGVGKMPVWRLVRVGTLSSPPLPFVGREAEMSVLALALQRATNGRSVLAVVSGPPGQGKTRLVQEFLRSRADGAYVIATRCRPPDEVGAFAPLRQILGVTTLDALADRVGRLCTDDVECERVVAGLAESAGIATSASLARLPAAEREDEIVQAWRRYLGLLGTDRLAILAIDDVHWADPTLVRLIDRLTFGGPRLLAVATARPEFGETAGIRPSGDRFFIELAGLEPDEARRLAMQAGRADDRAILRAEGNPLFIVELARARTEAELPLTLQGALGARLDELSLDDRSLLAAAAVAGERFTAADAGFLAERDVIEVGRALTRLVDLHFLDLAEGGYRFHHGLLRDVAYGRLLVADRMRAHARYARERLRLRDPASLAHHWWEALRPPDAEWVWAGEAGLAAMRQEAHRAHVHAATTHIEHFAVDAAIELLERAGSLADDDRARAEVEHGLGRAHGRVLRQDDAWAHMRRAVELHRAAGEVPLELYRDLMAAAWFAQAFRQIPRDEDVRAIADEGARYAKERGDHAILAQILRGYAGYLANQGSVERDEEARRWIDAAVEAAEASGDPETRRQVFLSKANALGFEGRVTEALGLMEELEQHVSRADALDRMDHARTRSNLALLAGDLDSAGRSANQAAALADPMGPHSRTHAWGVLAEVHLARGDWPKLVEVAHRTARMIADSPASAFCLFAALILRGGAIAHALAGEREEALGLIRAVPRPPSADTQEAVEIALAVPLALLGLPSPETDTKLRAKRRSWPSWGRAAMRAVVLGRRDDAEEALRQMGRITETSIAYSAFAEGVREAVAEMRGGPPAAYEALRKIGYRGWIDILKRRVDAEY